MKKVLFGPALATLLAVGPGCDAQATTPDPVPSAETADEQEAPRSHARALERRFDPIGRILAHGEELGLADDQVARLQELRIETRERSAALWSAVREDLGHAMRSRDRRRGPGAGAPEGREMRRAAPSELSEEDREALRQRMMERREGVRERRRERREEMRERMEALRPQLEELGELTRHTYREIENLLTEEQWERLQELRTRARREGRMRDHRESPARRH